MDTPQVFAVRERALQVTSRVFSIEKSVLKLKEQ
jgi:hypothetical protein